MPPNKALVLTAIPLRSIGAGYLGRPTQNHEPQMNTNPSTAVFPYVQT